MRQLVLKQEVVEAVAAGRFHVHAVTTIDEGIELLTGVAAGERGPDGAFPEGTVNARVEGRLRDLAEKARAATKAPEGAAAKNGEKA